MDFIGEIILNGTIAAAHAAFEFLTQAVPTQFPVALSGSTVEAGATALADVLGPTGTEPAAAPARDDAP